MNDERYERLGSRLSHVETRLAKVEEDVRGLDKALGIMGVELAQLSKDISEMRGDIKKGTWIVLGAIISAAVALILKGGIGG